MHEPRHWRDRSPNERLRATECQACGYVSFPERRITCKGCGEDPSWKDVQLEERGVVLSYVIQQRLPEAFETPLPIGVIDMPQRDGDGEPARVYGLFTETKPEDMAVGITVEADLREIFDVDGLPIHSFKFKRPRGDRL